MSVLQGAAMGGSIADRALETGAGAPGGSAPSGAEIAWHAFPVTEALAAFERSPFDTRPVPLLEGGVVLGTGVLLLLIAETEKALFRHFFARPDTAAGLQPG